MARLEIPDAHPERVFSLHWSADLLRAGDAIVFDGRVKDGWNFCFEAAAMRSDQIRIR
jgi:hypothetical protein